MVASTVTSLRQKGGCRRPSTAHAKTKPGYVMVALHEDTAKLCDDLRPRLEAATSGKFERPFVIKHALMALKAQMDRVDSSLTNSKAI